LGNATIIGSYRLEEPIGRGGMGIVYRGHHLNLPREVAIKCIGATSQRDLRRLRSRFDKEAFVQSQLDHPGIVKVYDYVVAEQTYYIIMEFVEGRSLTQLLAQEGRPLTLERALDLFEQMLAAIAYAQGFVYRDQDGSQHQGLIHRDLKPANIMVTPDDRIKITDFGIVKLVGSENTDTLGGSYGSPEYVSPEQAASRPVDPRSDIYSLGILLYEMLTGAPPFDSREGRVPEAEIVRAHLERTPQPPSELNPAVTPEIEAVIMRALEKSPERRFASAVNFLRAVRHARGRETGDITESTSPGTRARISVGMQEIDEPQFAHALRQSYATQPIGALSCAACGASADAGDKHCHECGHELNASPATVRLTRQDAAEWQRRRSLNLWAGAALVALLLGIGGVYLARRTAAPVNGSIPVQSVTPQPSQTPVPASALVELKPSRVKVDSSYDGYGPEPLTDGEADVKRIAAMRYNLGNWVSAETEGPHWIELDFDGPVTLAAVYLYWGFDRNRFMPSRRVELQVADREGGWREVSEVNPGNDHDRVAFEFAPVQTARARILQPAQQGPLGRPFVMWMREVKVFSVAAARQ
jgi:serine/threonine protein kinase